MAQLGKPQTIIYTAKSLRQGLTDVKAYVRKPSGSIIGPFPLSEMAHIKFKGIYTFDFITDSNTDDNGVYVGVIESPTEAHRVPFKINFEEISVAELSSIADEVADTLKLINQVETEIEVDDEVTEIEVFVDGE